MPETAKPQVLPNEEIAAQTHTEQEFDSGYLVICWDDPVNLMNYVSRIFQSVFGWPREKAERHMLEVHRSGKSVLIRETLEKAEYYVHQLQHYSLHATMERE